MAKVMAKVNKIQITQVKSSIGSLKNHKLCLQGLGLRRIRHSVEVIDTPENRGMLNKIVHLVTYKEV